MRIDEMQAGREMDCLIAEYVFEWGKDTPINVYNNHGYYQHKKLIHLSSDIKGAWGIVKIMRQKGFLLSLEQGLDYYYVSFEDKYERDYESIAPAAPLAISRAALKAVTGREEL